MKSLVNVENRFRCSHCWASWGVVVGKRFWKENVFLGIWIVSFDTSLENTQPNTSFHTLQPCRLVAANCFYHTGSSPTARDTSQSDRMFFLFKGQGIGSGGGRYMRNHTTPAWARRWEPQKAGKVASWSCVCLELSVDEAEKDNCSVRPKLARAAQWSTSRYCLFLVLRTPPGRRWNSGSICEVGEWHVTESVTTTFLHSTNKWHWL